MNRQEHLLTILAEECAEVAQRVSKVLRFGLHDVEPGQDMDNAERIHQELTDLYAVIKMLRKEGIIEPSYDGEAIRKKQEKVESYIVYAIQRGSLTEKVPEAETEEERERRELRELEEMDMPGGFW